MVLSQACAAPEGVQPPLHLDVEAGESSGTLDEVLDRAATQIEKETQLKRRVRGAMIYPAVVMTFALAGPHLHAVLHHPGLRRRLRQARWRTAGLTKYVMAMSDCSAALVHHLPGHRGRRLGLRKLKRTEKGRQVWDRFKLRVPMKIGDVVQKIALARMSRTLATLVAAGVDIISALEITGTTAGN